MIDLHGISQETFDDAVGYEVTSRDVYEKRCRCLTWPNPQSGPTGAIGHDFGQASRKQIAADWEGRISDAELGALLSCAGVTGPRARSDAAAARRRRHSLGSRAGGPRGVRPAALHHDVPRASAGL
ncbi:MULTISPECIES: hypothetical protein [unclassified Bradyrhizobium]|uniref:hypothetical protein n=1 Tax=unclassified Bradyrhizobium TaxID=2631580 RepID=UPI002915E5E9|nr:MULTISPECIES: hypothetical protein [unclassified Bradyrhizobium]